MVLGSLPFVLYLQAVRGGWGALGSGTRRCAGSSGWCCSSWSRWRAGRWQPTTRRPPTLSARAAFNGVSILTGTGYSTADFSAWGTFALPVFTLLMFIGGCTGATTGGVKGLRIQVLASTSLLQIRQLIQPHGVFISKFNSRRSRKACRRR